MSNTVETVLQQERKKSTLCPDLFGSALYGQRFYQSMKRYLEAGPTVPHDPNIYNKARIELMKDSYRYLPVSYNYNMNHHNIQTQHPHIRIIYNQLYSPHQIPGGVHFGMFLKYIELMGTEEQKQLYLEKSRKCDIIGCYAQTEVGHGSDIRSLETTAEYDQTTKQWIINSPTISSGKYWPGQLAFLANYAMVFAQTIVKGKNHGVNPFLVPLRDDNFNDLPGIERGDIGPKIGFHAKENGYLFLHHIRIPKANLMTKYAQITEEGDFKQVGDARIGYGTMMFIREIISCVIPKNYAQTLLIAARYSFYRKQFTDQKNKECSIMDYQTQQEKILVRIAEYYAITIAGTKIREISEDNGRKVLQKNFSLLQETHSNLCFSKALFSELIQEGMETLRRSMGGHGTSYYSGVPQIMNQFAANNTLEGENTVMYLQTARYVLKGYLGFITKGKPLTESLSYIGRLQDMSDTKFVGKNPWSIEELRDLLVKAVGHVVGIIGARISSKKPGETEMDIINHRVGIRLQQLAQLHGLHFMTNEFIKTIQAQTNLEIKQVLTDLCKLFTIGQIQRLAEPIIQGGFICPVKWALLNNEKQGALKRIRPHTAVLLDSFGIPDKYLRSQVVSGNPYQNFLNRARECEINAKVTKAALTVGKISQVLARPSL